MSFASFFLGSKNQDCLEQILSFLTIQELGRAASSCSDINKMVHKESQDASNVDVVWQGAEASLILLPTKSLCVSRMGFNARDHCRLFATASIFAKACDLSDQVAEEDRMMVDGMLKDLMNVRGYDEESIAKKKAIGTKDQRTVEEAAAAVQLVEISLEESQRRMEHRAELEQTRKRRRKEILKEKEPQKTYHHRVFVRITRSSSGELISQGFCSTQQKLDWHTGLEAGTGCDNFRQGLILYPNTFGSFQKTNEIKSFLQHYSAWEEGSGTCIFDQMRDFELGLNLTVVVIDKRDFRPQCLFQQKHMEEQKLNHVGRSHLGGFTKFSFQGMNHCQWGRDVVSLGESIYQDRFYLSHSFALHVAKSRVTGEVLLLPILEVDVCEDLSIHHLAVLRAMALELGTDETTSVYFLRAT